MRINEFTNKLTGAQVTAYWSSLRLAVDSESFSTGTTGDMPYVLASDLLSSISDSITSLGTNKADKTNVLQKDNTSPYAPSEDYHPDTLKARNEAIEYYGGKVVYFARSLNESENTVNPLTGVTEVINTNLSGNDFVDTIRKDIGDNYYLDLHGSDSSFLSKYFVEVIAISGGLRAPSVELINSGATLQFAFFDSSGNKKPTPFQIRITKHSF